MNVTYATHSPPKGDAFQQVQTSRTEYSQSARANADGTYSREINDIHEKVSQHISPHGYHKIYSEYTGKSNRTWQEYEYEYKTDADGNRVTITNTIHTQDAQNINRHATTTRNYTTKISNGQMYLVHTVFAEGYGGREELGENWDAYKWGVEETEITRYSMTTAQTSDVPVRDVSGGKLGMTRGNGSVYTQTENTYLYTKRAPRGNETQGNTNQPWGTYESNGKYLVWRGANAGHPNNMEVFAKKIIVKNITDAKYTGKNANDIGHNRHSFVITTKASVDRLNTTGITTNRVTEEVTDEAGIITGTRNKIVTNDRVVETRSDYYLNTYDAGTQYSVYKGGVISYEAIPLELIDLSPAEEAVENAVVTRGMDLGNISTTRPMQFGARTHDTYINTGRKVGGGTYTTWSLQYTRKSEIAFSESYRTNTDQMARELQYEHARTDRFYNYQRPEMVEVIEEYEHGGFVSGEGTKRYFSLNLQGVMLPAIVGKSNDYINSISTAVGMGMGAYLYDFSHTKRAKGFVKSKVKSYEITKGTYKTTTYTTVAPYSTHAVITLHNFSTLIDYTNRSIRANEKTNLLGLPTVFYTAHITKNEQDVTRIESCKYLVEESTVEEQTKSGVVATANCDDEQLFNYKNKFCGNITVSSVTVTLSQGNVAQYQMNTEKLEQFTYTKEGDTFQNRHGYNVTVNNGVKEGQKKTIYFSPIAQAFSYYMATTTTENDGHFLKGTRPDWFVTKFEMTQSLNHEDHFSIMPYLPTTQTLVDETTIYGSYSRTTPDVIGMTHWDSYYNIDYDRPYFQLMDQYDEWMHPLYGSNHYKSKVQSYCFNDFTRSQ